MGISGKWIGVGVLVGAMLSGVSGAQACGMIRVMPRVDPDLLMAKAAVHELEGRSAAAQRLYNDVMYDDYAPRGLRAEAALAAGDLQANAADRRGYVLEAYRLAPRYRSAQTAFATTFAKSRPKLAARILEKLLGESSVTPAQQPTLLAALAEARGQLARRARRGAPMAADRAIARR